MLPNEQQSVIDAKNRLDEQGKAHEPGRVVAELNFGFWTSLFSAPYEQSLLLPVLPTAFASMPTAMRTRRMLSKRVDDIRKLRNRVFHHEPVWNMPDLVTRHQEIVEGLSWINPRLQIYARIFDRFDAVYQGGFDAFRDKIEWHLLEEEEASRAAEESS